MEPILHFCIMATLQLAFIIAFKHKWVLIVPLIVAFAWELGGAYFEDKKVSLTDIIFTFFGGYYAIFLLWDKMF